MKKVLIPTMPEDFHALAVATALRAKGGEPTLWYTTDFPTRAKETAAFEGSLGQLEVRDIEGLPLDLGFDCLWNRRPREELAPAPLDPADRGFARVQCSRFRTAFLNILSQRAADLGLLCVNPWESAVRAENKLWQQHCASRIGLAMPQSLYTNDPDRIRQFIKQCGGKVAYKPFLGGLWDDGTTSWGSFTASISEVDLVVDELLQAVPGIYQEIVPKAHELRVTMIGERAFTARVNSQETEAGKLDWRRAYKDLTMAPDSIPEPLRLQCLELMSRLGIVFGCLDFIVTPGGQHIFLEVNQAGQFLFVEEYSGLPLLDAFSEFLLYGRIDFPWQETSRSIRLKDVIAASPNLFQMELDRHVRSQVPAAQEAAASAEQRTP